MSEQLADGFFPSHAMDQAVPGSSQTSAQSPLEEACPQPGVPVARKEPWPCCSGGCPMDTGSGLCETTKSQTPELVCHVGWQALG